MRRINSWRSENVEIHYRVEGQGPTLVLLHGFGGSHLDWELVAKDLCHQHRIVIPTLTNLYLDLNRRRNFDELVGILRRFVESQRAEGEESVRCAGASFGAALAWGLAVQEPSLIKTLFLVSPMPPDPGARLKDFRIRHLLKLAKYPTGVGLFLVSPMGRLFVPYLEAVFQVPWAKVKRRRKLAFLTDRKVKVISHSISRFRWIMANTDWAAWESRLGSVSCPTLVLWGDHDTLFSEREMVRFSQLIPNSELRTVIGGGHAMTREAPGSVYREIKKFLNDQTR